MMKFSVTVSLFVLLGVASTRPTELDARDPSNAPIDVQYPSPAYHQDEINGSCS